MKMFEMDAAVIRPALVALILKKTPVHLDSLLSRQPEMNLESCYTSSCATATVWHHICQMPRYAVHMYAQGPCQHAGASLVPEILF